MRRVELSASVKKRERPRAFDRYTIVPLQVSVRRRSLPGCGRSLSNRFHPGISDPLRIEAQRLAMHRRSARVRNRTDKVRWHFSQFRRCGT